ncbi:MAG: hypothetical protein BWY56_02044 [Acidobacteria bacterium ADurb.Bin340]|nr:MAG: hypothetical protein BWY56_02044 [Acidobacteria bacterium ADurb.Bin340]
MHDARMMGIGQAVADLGQDLQRFRAAQGLLAEQVLQIVALHVFHGDEEDALVLAEFIDRHQVGVVQNPCGPGLPLEALLGLLAPRGGRKDGLDGHLPPDGRVDAEVDLAHGPLPKASLDLELAKFFKHGSTCCLGLSRHRAKHTTSQNPGQDNRIGL